MTNKLKAFNDAGHREVHRNIKHNLHVNLKPVKHFTAAVFNYRAMKCIYDYLADTGTASKTSADSVHAEEIVNIQNHENT